jgi:NADPH:quinone reductase-like Zn-dependent oxidoreductase
MKAMLLAESPQTTLLIEKDIPQPELRRGEVLVRVYAAGVTPTELLWYPTSHRKNGDPRTGAVPCHEFSGEIARIGEGVAGLSAGQEIYGLNDWFAQGALAEYCVTQPDWIAPKPRRLSHPEAATVPIGALTAWQGLFDRAKIQSGEHVLVHGGAGAVGIFALQLARSRGARVTTTVSAHNLEFVKKLGANQAIDYKAARFEEAVRDIDVVFDTVGGDTLRRSWGVLKPGGRMVTVAADSENTRDERERQAFFIVEPNRQQLIEISRLLDAGELQTVVGGVLPLAQASDAYTGAVRKKGSGKLVVTLVESAVDAHRGGGR